MAERCKATFSGPAGEVIDPVTLIIDDRPGTKERAKRIIDRLPTKDGQVWDALIGPHRKKRTLTQNARLWLLHTGAGREVGCSPEDMHEDRLCAEFGYTEVRLPSGTMKRVPLKRSSDLNTKEFGIFMEAVETFYITELGFVLGDQ